MAGHLFVLRGDLLGIACDAALVPSDESLHLTEAWIDRIPEHLRGLLIHGDDWPGRLDLARDDNWGSGVGDVRSIPVPGWIAADGSGQAWVANVGDDEGLGVRWIVAGAVDFLERARVYCRAEPGGPAHGRARFLLAIPLVGSGAGGAAATRDLLQEALFPAVLAFLRRYDDVDVALVVRRIEDFAAAQRVRLREARDAWSELTPAMQAEASRLAEAAAGGDIVLFVGAGASRGAGVPGWDDLLSGLSLEAQLDAEAVNTFGNLDGAAIIASRLAKIGVAIDDAVGRVICADRYAMVDGLLAALPVRECVTTNYDSLLEDAFTAADSERAVLPWDYPKRGQGWVLKLHGDLRHPGSLVLTREDFLRYDDRRVALRGLVQGLLITREMLFVGYGLADDNFARIVDEVRKAVRHDDTPSRQFGTALILGDRPLLSDLWEQDVRILSFPGSMAEAGRLVEIFLDRMAAEGHAGAEYLLQPEYRQLLDEAESALADDLEALIARHGRAVRHSLAWRHLLRAITRLRGAGQTSPAP